MKSQVNSLKLYSKWAKPYLKAASQLQQKAIGGERQPALVTAFNTILLELTLLGKKKIDIDLAVANNDLPESFRGKKMKRDYYSCVLADFYFRGIPQRAGKHYVFGGYAEVTFKAYALNDDELKMLDQKLDESDLKEVLQLVSGATTESLEQIEEDIKEFIEEEKEEAEKKLEGEDVNPFVALLGIGKKTGKEEKAAVEEEIKKISTIRADTWMESLIREYGEDDAKDKCFTIFDAYKKAHNMASYT